MALPLVILGVRVGAQVAAKLGPRAISALKKMDRSQVTNVVNKVKNAIKSKDTKKLEKINKQIKNINKQKGPKNVESGPSVNQLKRIKTKETKLQKEKTAIAKRKEARKKKITSTVDLASRASLLPLIKRRKKEDKPIDNTKTQNKSSQETSSKKSITIREDDTLSQILKDTQRVGNPNFTLGMIKKANPGINLNKITPGQKIKLPTIVKKEGKSFIEENTLPKKDARTVDTTLTPLEKRKSVYQDVDMSKITMKKRRGGPLKNIPAGNKGLSNLPTGVRNKMGYNKKGGPVIKKASGGLIGGGAALRGFGAIRKR